MGESIHPSEISPVLNSVYPTTSADQCPWAGYYSYWLNWAALSMARCKVRRWPSVTGSCRAPVEVLKGLAPAVAPLFALLASEAAQISAATPLVMGGTVRRARTV